jgi:hypothetical protein
MRAEAGKTGLIDLWLACPIEKLYGFEGLGVVQEAFQGRIGLENAVWMVGGSFTRYSRFRHVNINTGGNL